MARTERVTYQCDVCGMKTSAQEVSPVNGQPFYIRPNGWGAMSGIVQLNSEDRIKEKWDFCSQECARSRFEKVMGVAYPA